MITLLCLMAAFADPQSGVVSTANREGRHMTLAVTPVAPLKADEKLRLRYAIQIKGAKTP